MRKSTYTLISLLLLALYCAASVSYALDAPHNIASAVDCDYCHYPSDLPAPVWATLPTPTGSTPLNELCVSCHHTNSSQITNTNPKFEDVKTHSSYETDPTATGADSYLMECRTCHNPHRQDQMRANPLLGNMDSGTTSSINASTLTDTTKSWETDRFKDALLIPNTAYIAYSYRIAGNTANTLTVVGAMKTMAPYTGVGKPYRIKYGKMIKEAIATPNSGTRAVTFLNNQGPNSFATSSVIVDGVCQVCHTKTGSYTNTGTLEGAGHPSLKTGTNCTVCHYHSSGFKHICGTCHGYPPVTTSLGGPNGLANNEGGTGSTSPGGHQRHIVSLGYFCATCHTGGMLASTSYDKLIQIGFSIAGGAYQSGGYDGTTSLANGYTYTGGNPGTIVINGGTKVCSNVYCHGATMAPNNGTNTAPVWDNPATAVCGSCHGATLDNFPTRGSHEAHVSSIRAVKLACTICHNEYPGTHVNGQAEVSFSTDPRSAQGAYSGTRAMLDAYGGCSAVYCHSNVQSSPPGGAVTYASPTWGNSATVQCGTCHRADGVQGSKNLMDSGTHPAHVGGVTETGADAYPCSTCHWGKGSGVSSHADGLVDVSLDPAIGGNYSGSQAPGDAYGQCNNVYCHSTVQGSPAPTQPPQYKTPTWGQVFSEQCGMGACHDVGFPHTEDASLSKYAAMNKLTSGSHAQHLKYKFDQSGNCEACHYKTGNCPDCHYAAATHVDHTISVAFDPQFPARPAGGGGGVYSGDSIPQTPYGACSNLYCHSPGTKFQPPYGNPIVNPVSWGSGTLTNDCTGCHGGDGNAGTKITTGSHGKHVTSSGIDCSLCHTRTVSNSRTLNTTIDSGARTFGYNYHVNGWIDIAFSNSTATNVTYAGQPIPAANRAPGSAYGVCANTYCHSNGTGGTNNVGKIPPIVNDPRPIATNTTATWGTAVSLHCNSCHGNTAFGDWRDAMPYYASGTPKANMHIIHEYANFTCNYCHFATTTTGTTITNSGKHMNGLYDVTPDPTRTYNSLPVNFTYAYDAGGGTCTNNACHHNASWSGQSITAQLDWKLGNSCWEIDFFGGVSGGSAPYSYTWDFGDSTTSTEQNPAHFYPSGNIYNVTCSVRDAKSLTGTATQNITPIPVNISPTAAITVSVKGFTVTAVDQSYDPDYNQCGHSGPGTINISWGDTTGLSQGINLIDTPSGIVYSHTYLYSSSSKTYTISHSITDNKASTVTPPSKKVMVPSLTTVSGRVTHADSSAFSGVLITITDTDSGYYKQAVTDATGNYASSVIPEARCYTVVPSKGSYTFTPSSRAFCTDSGPVLNVDFVSNQ